MSDFDLVVSFDVQGTTLDELTVVAKTKINEFFGTGEPINFVIHTVTELTRFTAKDSGNVPDWGSYDPPIYAGQVYASRSRTAIETRILNDGA